MQTGKDVDSGSDMLTLREAERLLMHYQDLAGSGAPDRMIEAFTPDVVVRFADFPEMRGRAELKRFLVARVARQKKYSLKKRLRALSGDVIICSWDGTWEDGRDGRSMQGSGLEIMTIRGGKVKLWEAVFNVWEQGTSGSLPIV
jgi:nuclear transport factor 2 (NTF2) superfamily protein